MENREKDTLLKFIAKTKEGKYAEVEKSSFEYVRMEIETDMSSEHTEYLYSVR